MNGRPLTPAYLNVARLIRELHRLDVAGRNESPEADALRDEADWPWEELSEAERERARWLSDDLITLTEKPELRPMTPEARRQFTDAVLSTTAGDWDRALALLRGLAPFVAPEVLSSYRGAVWLGMGDADTAAVFLDHAARMPAPARRA